MDLPTFTHEKKLLKKGFGVVAGMDEVGRGAGFGPLVVAVVALKDAKLSGLVNDSKLLTKERRVLLSEKIYQEALGVGLGVGVGLGLGVSYTCRCRCSCTCSCRCRYRCRGGSDGYHAHYGQRRGPRVCGCILPSSGWC